MLVFRGDNRIRLSFFGQLGKLGQWNESLGAIVTFILCSSSLPTRESVLWATQNIVLSTQRPSRASPLPLRRTILLLNGEVFGFPAIKKVLIFCLQSIVFVQESVINASPVWRL